MRITALLLMTLAAGLVSAKGVESQEIPRLLLDGNNAISNKEFEFAAKKCQTGLQALGDAYVTKVIEDDTGQKLALAEIFLRQGKVESASLMYCRILAERLKLFEAR
ncbi:hypothetical protein [Duganella fentianensis]|uniref:hypothetical protein n=1 Tax=Duganella fentianensis TaxID=2692177 RepID=UPI0032B232BF